MHGLFPLVDGGNVRLNLCLLPGCQVICWVLGEYGAPGSPERAFDVITKLVAVVDQQTVSDSAKGYLLSALAKLCCQTGASLTRDAEVFVRSSASSRNADLQQRALEIQALLSCDVTTRSAALPPDASCEDLEVRQCPHERSLFQTEQGTCLHM